MISILDSRVIDKGEGIAENERLILVDNRSWISYSVSLCASLYREGISRLQRSGNPYKNNAQSLFAALQKDGTYEKKQAWLNAPSSRLIVLIHGLDSSPLCWSKYIRELSKCDPSINYFAPYVYKKGYCKLKEAALPILEVARDYAKQYPDNPIFLIGHSNGARIAEYIEAKMDAKDIRLISIAGPHFGSNLINWIERLRFNELIGISEFMTKELRYNGVWVNKKLNRWQKKSTVKADRFVKRIFFASADDLRVFPHDTSFPKLPDSTYYLISGESHITIIDAVSDIVLNEIKQA